jgi:pimeloyl-ACP methyl ester carboxylesterase
LNSGSTELLPEIPRLLTQVSKGNYDQLKAFLVNYIQNSQSGSVGMTQRVFCDEFLANATVQQVKDADAKASPLMRDFFDNQVQGDADACKIWQTDNKVKFNYPPVLKSDIPSLIIAGNYGWATPVSWATQAAKGLTRSSLVVFPDSGQVPNFNNAWTDCTDGIISAFLNAPGKKLDTTCTTVKKSTLWITLP